MGGMQDDLKAKIEEMEEVNTAGRKLIDVAEFRKRKQKLQEETYIWLVRSEITVIIRSWFNLLTQI